MSIFRAFLGCGKRVSEHDIQVLEADKKALSDMLNRHRDELDTARRQLLESASRVREAEKAAFWSEKRAQELEAKLAEVLAVQPVRRRPGRPRKVLSNT